MKFRDFSRGPDKSTLTYEIADGSVLTLREADIELVCELESIFAWRDM